MSVHSIYYIIFFRKLQDIFIIQKKFYFFINIFTDDVKSCIIVVIRLKEKSETMKKYIFIIFAAMTMVMIFFFSMENSSESAYTSGGVTEFIIEHFFSGYQKMPASEKKIVFQAAEYIIRKLAHFSVYTLLGLLISFAIGKRRFLSSGSLVVTGIGFLYACSDEFHQYFVPGRSCHFTDVIIDTCGVIFGIVISMVLFQIYDRFKHKFSGSPS